MTRRRIPGGNAGVLTSLTTLVRLARDGAQSPIVWAAARAILGRIPPPENGIGRLRLWLADHVIYQEDPPGVELVRSPTVALARIGAYGVLLGDCDDVAVLAAALGLAAGYRARYVLTGWGAGLSHVWAELLGPAGWVELDVTRPEGPVVRPLKRITRAVR